MSRASEQVPKRNEVQENPERFHLSIDSAEEKRERAEQTERKHAVEAKDKQEIDNVLESLEREPDAPTAGPFRQELYGAFAGEKREGGKIILEGRSAEAAGKAAAEFRNGAKAFSNLVVGEKIAAEYDSPTSNFRAQTRLTTLPDGRKVFMIYDYQGSWAHRTMDGLMKRLNGLPMRKADREEWKKWHEAKTSIPVIENGDPHMAMMPFVPNANGKDVFANNAEIGNFGACGWAKEAGLEEKNALSGKVINEMKRFHDEKGAWGEAVLSNVIFTEQQEPVMCDFEVAYDEDVPLAEAKARDLKDMCISISAALEKAHGQDIGATVTNLLDHYDDPAVINELKKLASKKRGVLKNLFFGYEQARTGAKSKKQYDAISKAIEEYHQP